jgi:hypothetical protein
MATSSAQMQTLARALKDCGSEQVLARKLGVAAADLARWLTGRDTLPVEVYCKTLVLVAPSRRA